ncbi:MAG TPA: hypothetical protein VGJ41_11620 [Nocardioides sp.]
MGLEADFNALTHDAKEWHDTATKLQECANLVKTLTLDGEFSFMAPLVSLDGNYESTRAHVEKICTAGHDQTKAIGDALIKVRDILQGSDEAAKAKLHGLWDPVV